MPKPKHPPEVKQEALILAAGQSASVAARQLGLEPRTVRRWVAEADPRVIAQYVAEKRARATQVVLDRTEAAVTGIMDELAVGGQDANAAKALQARATALGILDDHYGGRPTGSSGGARFGNRDDQMLAGWSDADRLTLERIERVTLEKQPEP